MRLHYGDYDMKFGLNEMQEVHDSFLFCFWIFRWWKKNLQKIWYHPLYQIGLNTHLALVAEAAAAAFEDYLLSASEKQASKDFECEARFLNKHDGKNKLILIISSPLAIEVHKNWVIDRFFSHRDRLW